MPETSPEPTALTASSKAVQDQQAVVQGLQAQWNAAKQAIQDYQSVKLAGETGSNQQIQQAGYKVDTAQLQLLQAQAAGLSGDALKPYQDAVQQAQLQLQLLQQQAKVTYQPLHDQLKAAADAANGLNKEMAFPDALKGIQDQGAAMARLGPAIAGATKHLDALKESQAQAQAAVAAANAAVQQQQQVLQQLQQAQQAAAQGTQAVASGMQAVNSSLAQTGPALATVGPAVQGMLTGMGTSLDAQMVAADKSTIWGKWWGPSGLLGVMLARLGNTGQSGVQGGGFSFIPNVIAAFRGLLEAQLPGLLAADLPPMTQTWAQWLQQMKDATQTFVPDMTTVGNNLIQGIAAGITSGTHFVVEAAQNAVKAAIAAANAQAESKSPSERAAREVGLPLAQGMAVGIQRGIPTIAAAAQAAVNAALPGASGGLVGAGAGAGIGTFAPTIYVSVGGGPWQLGTATASLTPGALSEDLAFERRNRRAGNP